MSDYYDSDTSLESDTSIELLERFINLGVLYQSTNDEDEPASSTEDVFWSLYERYGNIIPITRDLASRIIEINSPYYNAVLNNRISFPFDVPIGTTNSKKSTPEFLDHLREKRFWTSQNFVEHTRIGTLRQIPIYSGIIHQVSFWCCQQMPTCLYEITAELIGIAQKYPLHSVCEGNEAILLIRDIIKHDPVLQVTLPYYLYPKIPRFNVGQMIKCVGVMMDTHLMQAVRVSHAGYVKPEDRIS